MRQKEAVFANVTPNSIRHNRHYSDQQLGSIIRSKIYYLSNETACHESVVSWQHEQPCVVQRRLSWPVPAPRRIAALLPPLRSWASVQETNMGLSCPPRPSLFLFLFPVLRVSNASETNIHVFRAVGAEITPSGSTSQKTWQSDE